MALTFEKPPEQPRPNVLLYGPPKTGKTAAAASAPGSSLYLNLDLPNAVRYAHEKHNANGRVKFPVFEGMQTLIDIYLGCQQDPTWDVVVVDPIGDLYRRLLEEASRMPDGKVPIRPTLNQYGDIGVHLERWCRSMCATPNTSFIIVGHEFPVENEATETVEKLVWTGTKAGSASLSQKLMGMVDIVAYCGVVPTEDGDAQYMGQLVSQDGRRGGDRFDVLAPLESLDLADWFERIGVPSSNNVPPDKGDNRPTDESVESTTTKRPRRTKEAAAA